jgi:hypothetical protein
MGLQLPIVILDGQPVIAGGVLSMTVTVKLKALLLLLESVNV